MAEADGTPVPLDQSDKDRKLPSYIAVPPPKIIPEPVEQEPPDKKAPKRNRNRHYLKFHLTILIQAFYLCPPVPSEIYSHECILTMLI